MQLPECLSVCLCLSLFLSVSLCLPLPAVTDPIEAAHAPCLSFPSSILSPHPPSGTIMSFCFSSQTRLLEINKADDIELLLRRQTIHGDACAQNPSTNQRAY